MNVCIDLNVTICIYMHDMHVSVIICYQMSHDMADINMFHDFTLNGTLRSLLVMSCSVLAIINTFIAMYVTELQAYEWVHVSII